MAEPCDHSAGNRRIPKAVCKQSAGQPKPLPRILKHLQDAVKILVIAGELMRIRPLSTFVVCVVWMFLSLVAIAQTIGPAPVAQRETPQDLLARLTPEQKQKFDAAGQAFRARHYPDALSVYKQLLTELPGDPVLSKFATEAALNNRDSTYALATIKPVAEKDPDDWQAAALQIRACAEAGDVPCRDTEIAHMQDLHNKGVTPSNMRDYIVEQVQLDGKSLRIRLSLVPWGNYHVYALAQVVENDGSIPFRAALESGDMDQPLFAKEHPDLAAKGIRRFSLDGYQETGINSQGQRTQTHFTYKFFDGQPSYADVREEFLSIVNGKVTPLSSRTNLIVP